MITSTVDPRTAVLNQVRELPPLPVVIHQLLAVMRNPDCSAEDITRVLSTDQALASKILRLVNSSFYGMSGNVGTISRAVVILGHGTLRSIATALTVADAIGRVLPPQRRHEFWQHALGCAAGAEIIGRRVALPDPEEAFVAGLMHDIGHLILMLALPGEHTKATTDRCLGEIEKERSVIGLDHCRAGRMLLQHWKLPNFHQDCVRWHHATESCLASDRKALAVVALADRMASIAGECAESPRTADDALRLAESLGLTAEALFDMLPAISARAREARLLLVADEEVETAVAAPKQRVVVISGDPARAAWLTRLLGVHGHTAVPLRDHLATPAEHPAGVILVDGLSINPAQAAKLAPVLAASSARLCAVSAVSDLVPPSRRADCRVIPLMFSAGDCRF